MKFTDEHKTKISQSHLARQANVMENILQMAKNGKTTKEIAEHSGKTVKNINKILSRQGIKAARGPNIRKGKSTKPEKIAEICKMATEGKTAQEIVNHYKTLGYTHSVSHIYTILDNAGIVLKRFPNGRPRANPDKINKICEMFKEGFCHKDIAEYFECTTGYIAKVLTSNDLRSRKPNNSRPDGYSCDGQGYLWTQIEDDDPLACMRLKNDKRVSVHRLTMARKLNRPLLSHETVHHIDGNKENNHIDNLQLRIGKHGKGTCMECVDCNSTDINTTDYLKCNTCNSTRIRFKEL